MKKSLLHLLKKFTTGITNTTSSTVKSSPSSDRTMTQLEKLQTPTCIVGSWPATHTATIYTARAELKPMLFEGFIANGIAADGKLTTTTNVENFLGFLNGILGHELTDKFREQSLHFSTQIFMENVECVDLSVRPFTVCTEKMHVDIDTIIIATGVIAKWLDFPGAGDDGYCNKLFGTLKCFKCV